MSKFAEFVSTFISLIATYLFYSCVSQYILLPLVSVIAMAFGLGAATIVLLHFAAMMTFVIMSFNVVSVASGWLVFFIRSLFSGGGPVAV